MLVMPRPTEADAKNENAKTYLTKPGNSCKYYGRTHRSTWHMFTNGGPQLLQHHSKPKLENFRYLSFNYKRPYLNLHLSFRQEVVWEVVEVVF